MAAIDWMIILLYLSGMIGMSIYLGRKQEDQDDYYVAGRNMSWWAIGISTMATQSSAISFISKPAFVALRPGGGLTWLQYELAVPLAMIVIMMFLIPFFRRLRLVSVYEYMELRYDASVRYLVSGVFLFSRGLAAGVVVYTTAIVLEVCLGLPLWITILFIGVVTIVYDTIGGIAAVVYSDVIQMVILMSGIFICVFYAANMVGGFSEMFALFPEERMATLDFRSGFNGESSVPFWGLLIGGFFLYISYYGTDQSQVQREMATESEDGTKRSLLLNGFARFPLTASYMLMGIAIYAVYVHSPELQAAIPEGDYDYLVPQFVLIHLPTGIRGILFAAILSATMSTLDSVLNSLSASTMKDFVERANKGAGDNLFLGKLVTVIWGIAITGFAFFVGNIDATVVEGINKIGSAFYGPILAAFLTGVISRRVNANGIFSGIIAGVGINICLWLFFPAIFWMWWNFFGLIITVAVAFLFSYLYPVEQTQQIERYTLRGKNWLESERRWFPKYLMLFAYFIIMLVILVALNCG